MAFNGLILEMKFGGDTIAQSHCFWVIENQSMCQFY